MSASYFGGEVKETQRYKLGKLLGTRTRNLLLMSATPHNGKEADFQLFMGLLDADRFRGAVPRRHPQGRCLGHDAPADQGRALPLRRHAAVSRAPRLHGQLRALSDGGRSLPGGHHLRPRGDEPRRSQRRRQRGATMSASPCKSCSAASPPRPPPSIARSNAGASGWRSACAKRSSDATAPAPH